MSDNGMNAGEKLAEAVHQGHGYCEVCDSRIDFSDVRGFDAARSRLLNHAEEEHE